MTQLVDVILVLMIVFMVTSPLIRNTVKIDPPHASSQKQDTTPTHIDVSDDADGTVLLDGMPVDDDAWHDRFTPA